MKGECEEEEEEAEGALVCHGWCCFDWKCEEAGSAKTSNWREVGTISE